LAEARDAELDSSRTIESLGGVEPEPDEYVLRRANNDPAAGIREFQLVPDPQDAAEAVVHRGLGGRRSGQLEQAQ
jgi:hypothetical protein